MFFTVVSGLAAPGLQAVCYEEPLQCHPVYTDRVKVFFFCSIQMEHGKFVIKQDSSSPVCVFRSATSHVDAQVTRASLHQGRSSIRQIFI